MALPSHIRQTIPRMESQQYSNCTLSRSTSNTNIKKAQQCASSQWQQLVGCAQGWNKHTCNEEQMIHISQSHSEQPCMSVPGMTREKHTSQYICVSNGWCWGHVGGTFWNGMYCINTQTIRANVQWEDSCEGSRTQIRFPAHTVSTVFEASDQIKLKRACRCSSAKTTYKQDTKSKSCRFRWSS